MKRRTLGQLLAKAKATDKQFAKALKAKGLAGYPDCRCPFCSSRDVEDNGEGWHRCKTCDNRFFIAVFKDELCYKGIKK